MSQVKLHLDWCSHRAAKYAVERWHYSRSLAVGKMIKIGVWENDIFIGCILFNYGANPNLYKQYNIKFTECAELTRVALNKHITEVTKIIKVAISMVKKYCPGLRLLISFADQNQGHYGAIYQGGNWIYSGVSKSTPQYFIKGRWVHRRSTTALQRKDVSIKKREILDKFRYLMPLDKQMRKQTELLKKEYPKKINASVV